MGSVGTPWLVFVVAATWKSLSSDKGLPRPSVYTGSAVVFSLLALVGTNEKARPVAAVFGWALVVAELVKGDLLQPGGTSEAAYEKSLATANSPAAAAAIKAKTAAAAATAKKQAKGTTIAGPSGAGAGNKKQR